MIEVEHVDVWGFQHAIRGMRNPLNSWGKSDSYGLYADEKPYENIIGPNDITLMKTLFKAGTEHRSIYDKLWCLWILLRLCIGGKSSIHTKSELLLIAAAQCI